jgi:hypothetical protein
MNAIQNGGAGPIQYFWGDNRPGLGFNFHALNVDATPDIGKYISLQIRKDIYTSNEWDIIFNGTQNPIAVQYSTSNTMTAPYSGDYIIQGIYTRGAVNSNTGGTNSTSTGIFTNNAYRNGLQQYIPQTQNGTIIQGGSGQPPYMGWYYLPSSSTTGDGGQMWTQCC